MADITKTVSVLFQGTDDISDVINKMGKNIDSFGDDISDIGAPFAEATEQVLALTAAVAGVAVAGLLVSSSIETEAARMANSLGLTNEEAAKFEDIAKEAYKAGWGDDLADAFETVALAQKKLGDNADTDIGKVTENALKLQSVFGTDINASLGAVSNLMQNFKITSVEAFDFIAKGFQAGLDGSGDFLDSITEYGTQFANGGADAAQFFSVLQSGYSEGYLGTDRAADLFKEFRVRIQDESVKTKEALESIGIDPAVFAANMASGELTAVEAFNQVQIAINETTDKTVQFNAGVGLMGTQFEDLGTSAALALNTTNTGMKDLIGTLDDIDPDAFAKKFLQAIRTITVEFGDLQEWDEVKEKLGTIFEDIAASFGPALDNVDFTGLEDKVGDIWETLRGVFTDADLDITTLEGMTSAIQLIIDSVESLAVVVGGIVDVLAPVAAAVINVVKGFNELPDGLKETTGLILGLGTALVGLGTVISVGGTLVSALGSLAGIFSTGGTLFAGISAVVAVLSGPVGLAVGLAAVATAVAGYSLGNVVEEHQKVMAALDAESDAISVLLDDLAKISTSTATAEVFVLIEEGDLDGARAKIDELTEEDKLATIKVETEQDELNDFFEAYEGIDPDLEVQVTAAINAGDFDKVNELLDGMADEKTVTVKAETQQATETITYWTDTQGEISIEIPVETEGVDDAIKKIEEIPTDKQIEIKLQGEIDTQIATIIASADTAQAAFEWTAQVDIAEAQAAAEMVVAAFDAAGESVSALAGSTADMFGDLVGQWDTLSQFDQNVLMRNVESQQDAQNAALASQTELNAAQAEYLTARAGAVRAGDAAITIDSSGLEPSLEMIMMQIIQKIQIRATESASEFLLGV
ncbi:MAG: hypothetical protein GY941_23710 [Planctomycetes bacterium]|nr:hypothetical protein [Planctomycetota bacterium]